MSIKALRESRSELDNDDPNESKFVTSNEYGGEMIGPDNLLMKNKFELMKSTNPKDMLVVNTSRGSSFVEYQKEKTITEANPPIRNLAPLLKYLRIRNTLIRELLGEFMGTMILCVLGMGSGCQRTLIDHDYSPKLDDPDRPPVFSQPFGGFFTSAFGWGMAVMVAIFCTGKICNGHLNPAISLAMAIRGNINWLRFVLYIVVQLLGAFFGSLILFLNYKDLIDRMEFQKSPHYPKGIAQMGSNTNGSTSRIGTYSGSSVNMHNIDFFYNMESTGQIFVTKPLMVDGKPFLSSMTMVMNESLGTMLFVLGIIAITDSRNFNVPDYFQPLSIGLLLYCVINSFDLNCGAALNPARDFGPRVMLSFLGWGSAAFTQGRYHFWIPVVGPFIGGFLAAVFYSMLIGAQLPSDENMPGDVPVTIMNGHPSQMIVPLEDVTQLVKNSSANSYTQNHRQRSLSRRHSNQDENELLFNPSRPRSRQDKRMENVQRIYSDRNSNKSGV